MKKLTVYIFIVSAILAGNCRKSNQPTSLPPITQEGKNTFGCKMNGQLWVPYYRCNRVGFNTAAREMIYSTIPVNPGSAAPVVFFIHVGNSANDGTHFDIFSHASSVFYLSGTGNIIDSLTIQFDDGLPYQNRIGRGSPHYFQITKFDTLQKIISGEFAFNLYDFADSFVVTEGRFDIQMRDYVRCSN
ncbi:MAG TPA: hypothetical protein VK543_09965 [Puia sp.]|nr:hypothetical protein [Puia sp.]